ncbi:response regulator [Candidatus Endoriftia persephone]|jgi:diguanylate cyclase (GGDEF)-like protein|uniref:Two-component system response regulator n=3 Tax=Gammaproteobacteria TaxID=1236 RepID=G2FHU8_9GAMM|nr:response regulator [Candidatus Endoriftia persephone]EGW53627.1 two-component system response regulator [endosymbiont of Tevnia jerichonana (vent Tica)]USF88371.1 response regulator [Candidatus Endoriftia persephone]
MQDSRQPQTSKTEELKQIFLGHLPERLAAIDKSWQALDAHWDPILCARLYHQIQDLTGASGRFGLLEISQEVFSLETELGQFVDSGLRPNETELAELDQQMARLQQALSTVCARHFNLAIPSQPTDEAIYYLRHTEEIAPGLVAALEAKKCIVLTYSRADDLLAEMEKRVPQLLLIDTVHLPALKSITDAFEQLKKQQKPVPKLLFLSRAKELELRLQAMRAGAEGYFVPPYDISELADRIHTMTEPDEGPSYRVLIVEDDPAQADFASAVLRKSGIDSLIVTEPLKILEALDQYRPDLILMDLYMPDADGIELTSIIREQPQFIGTPIVFLSGEQNTEKQLDALSVGGDDFIAKPIRPRFLITTVINRIQRSRMLQQTQKPVNSRDPLTGLSTRRHFYEHLDSLLLKSDPSSAGLGVIYLELDIRRRGGGSANGQDADDLLRQIGSMVSGSIEPQDIAARYDERTIVVLAQRPHINNLNALAEQIRKQIASHRFVIGGREHRIIPNVGLCQLDDSLFTASEMLSRSANAASSARATGINQVVQFSVKEEPLDEDSSDEALFSHISHSLEENSIQLLFLPYSDTQGGNLEFHELIPRLMGSHGESIPTARINLVAQRTGLFKKIDRWLLEHALSVLDQRRQQGRPTALIIHQSMESVQDTSNLSWIREQLRLRQLVGTGIFIEFDLADLAANLKQAKSYIRSLQEMGINVILSRFIGNDTAFKVLGFLKPNCVRLSKRLVKAKQDKIDAITGQLQKRQIKIILPRIDNPSRIPKTWEQHADLVQSDFFSA